MISVLYVRQDSIYKELGCDCWDMERDARNFPGGNPIIAHPPCRAWGRFRHLAKPRIDEKELAIHAIEQIRKWGGVLEHPEASKLWEEMNLPLPGKEADIYGGWSLAIWQSWFGHKAKKKTWLYIVGCFPKEIPPYQLNMDAIQYILAPTFGTRRANRAYRKSLPKKDREATPIEFAKWLISLAEKCKR